MLHIPRARKRFAARVQHDTIPAYSELTPTVVAGITKSDHGLGLSIDHRGAAVAQSQ